MEEMKALKLNLRIWIYRKSKYFNKTSVTGFMLVKLVIFF